MSHYSLKEEGYPMGKALYIGLMSGTSADGIDAILADFSEQRPRLIGTYYLAYPDDLRKKIRALYTPCDNEIDRQGELDAILGNLFADAALTLLEKQGISSDAIMAIGSHGQTIRHRPQSTHPFSLQIADPNIIAAKTGITTIADFRRKDIALGGQGAPLVPAFHQAIFASDKSDQAIVNIGGIANITLLSAKKNTPVIGFDTGPGNVLLDAWIQLHEKKQHDADGQWGRQGKISSMALSQFLTDDYFQSAPPKSTGQEYFNLDWLKGQLAKCDQPLSARDVQATLTELTAITIIEAIKKYFSEGEILVCGGGTHNLFLMERLKVNAGAHFTAQSTADAGVSPDWVEALAFAWLAKQTLSHAAGNLPSVTGATRASILGGIYFP